MASKSADVLRAGFLAAALAMPAPTFAAALITAEEAARLGLLNRVVPESNLMKETMALAETIGKSEAHHLVEAASKKAVTEKKHLRDVLTKDSNITAHLSEDKLTELFEPMAYQGVSQALIDRLLASLEGK